MRFLYDRDIFASDVSYSPDAIATRLHELAFLNSGATIRFRATHKGRPVEGSSKYLANRPARGGASGEGPGQEPSTSSASDGTVKNSRRSRRSVGANIDTEGVESLDASVESLPQQPPLYGLVRKDGEWQLFQFSGGLREFVGCLQVRW